MTPNSELIPFFTPEIGSRRIGTILAPVMYSDKSLKILMSVKANLLPNVK
jgi:hypothetical protein